MGMLSMKYNSAEMAQTLSMMLQPGENMIAAVYCAFHRGAFEMGASVMAGYVGVTDQHRLIGIRCGLVGEEPFSVWLQGVKKLIIKNSFFGSKMITLKTDNLSMRMQITPKADKKKFPDQKEYMELMLPVLQMYQTG
ncbi:MAG: hypothetical protein IJ060_12365 [Oscillospiraceae bacterium]|nr:hypothetical protein [Oscillospiraceae bacterium]